MKPHKLIATFLSSTLLSQVTLPTLAQDVIQPADPLWTHYVDVDQFPEEGRDRVVETLNWLEKYFGGFHEILWDLKDLREKGKMPDNIEIIHDSDGYGAYFSWEENKLNLDFLDAEKKPQFYDPSYYLGMDGKLYVSTLGDTLVHELEHGAQRNSDIYERARKERDEFQPAMEAKFDELKAYLLSKGVPERRPGGDYEACEFYDFIQVFDTLTNERCDASILNDPEYERLHNAWLKDRMHVNDIDHRTEDLAMNMADSLNGILGKPARGDYNDLTLFDLRGQPESDQFYDSLSPEEVRLRGNETIDFSETVKAYPLMTGDYRHLEINVANMQCRWAQKWNADTLNITPEEWVEVNDAKMEFFAGRDFFSLTEADRAAYDAMVKELLARFNEEGPKICTAPSYDF